MGLVDHDEFPNLWTIFISGALPGGLEVESSSQSRPNVHLLQKNGDENDFPECVPDVEDHPLHRDHQPLERQLLLCNQLLHWL